MTGDDFKIYMMLKRLRDFLSYDGQMFGEDGI
jgi:hypothetical protein